MQEKTEQEYLYPKYTKTDKKGNENHDKTGIRRIKITDN